MSSVLSRLESILQSSRFKVMDRDTGRTRGSKKNAWVVGGKEYRYSANGDVRDASGKVVGRFRIREDGTVESFPFMPKEILDRLNAKKNPGTPKAVKKTDLNVFERMLLKALSGGDGEIRDRMTGLISDQMRSFLHRSKGKADAPSLVKSFLNLVERGQANVVASAVGDRLDRSMEPLLRDDTVAIRLATSSSVSLTLDKFKAEMAERIYSVSGRLWGVETGTNANHEWEHRDTDVMDDVESIRDVLQRWRPESVQVRDKVVSADGELGFKSWFVVYDFKMVFVFDPKAAILSVIGEDGLLKLARKVIEDAE